MPRTSSSPLLFPLLPRSLNPLAGDETATIFQSLVARVHLDRPLARRLGWRGVRPGAAKGPAWTFRTAGAQGVYGVLFEGERPTETGLEGFFTFFFFPDEEEALRTDFSPDVRRAVARSDYETLVRDLSMNADALTDFAFGLLTLSISADLDSLSLAMEARASEEILTETGEVYAKDRPLRMLQPGFALLVESARAVLGGPSRLVWTSEKTPALRIVRGEPEPDPVRTEFSVRETFAVGSAAATLSGRPLADVPLRHVPSRREEPRPIVHVVSGFLGSGKTTFIASWLNFLHGRERFTGVLQNEFGEMDLDSLVLSGETKVESLDDGCVCCSLADSLRPGLLRLLESTPAEQFILETTGVASPSYVMAQLQLLDETITPGLLITLADALDLSRHPEHLAEAGCRRDQFEAADIIVLTKADRVSKTEAERLGRRDLYGPLRLHSLRRNRPALSRTKRRGTARTSPDDFRGRALLFLPGIFGASAAKARRGRPGLRHAHDSARAPAHARRTRIGTLRPSARSAARKGRHPCHRGGRHRTRRDSSVGGGRVATRPRGRKDRRLARARARSHRPRAPSPSLL